MAISSAGAQGYASAVTGAASAAAGILGIIQAQAAARDAARAAEAEIRGLQLQANEAEFAARRRAYAALQDAALNRVVVAQNIEAIEGNARIAEGQIVAQTAGNGLAFIGSPVLAAAAANLEFARQAEAERVGGFVSQQRFEFEIDRELRQAAAIKTGSAAQIEGTRQLRQAQADAIIKNAGAALASGAGSASGSFSSLGGR